MGGTLQFQSSRELDEIIEIEAAVEDDGARGAGIVHRQRLADGDVEAVLVRPRLGVRLGVVIVTPTIVAVRLADVALAAAGAVNPSDRVVVKAIAPRFDEPHAAWSSRCASVMVIGSHS